MIENHCIIERTIHNALKKVAVDYTSLISLSNQPSPASFHLRHKEFKSLQHLYQANDQTCPELDQNLPSKLVSITVRAKPRIGLLAGNWFICVHCNHIAKIR